MNPLPFNVVNVTEAGKTGRSQSAIPVHQPPATAHSRPIDWRHGALALWQEPWFRRVLIGSTLLHVGFLLLSMVIRWHAAPSAADDAPQLPALVALAPTTTTLSPAVARSEPARVRPRSLPSISTLPAPALTPSIQLPALPATTAATAELSKVVNRLSLTRPALITRPAMPASVLPRYHHHPNRPPAYPVTARQRGWQGTTVVEVEVSASGAARNVTVCRSSGYGLLDRAAVEAVRRWQFDPGRIGETAIAMLVQIPIVFQLADG